MNRRIRSGAVSSRFASCETQVSQEFSKNFQSLFRDRFAAVCKLFPAFSPIGKLTAKQGFLLLRR